MYKYPIYRSEHLQQPLQLLAVLWPFVLLKKDFCCCVCTFSVLSFCQHHPKQSSQVAYDSNIKRILVCISWTSLDLDKHQQTRIIFIVQSVIKSGTICVDRIGKKLLTTFYIFKVLLHSLLVRSCVCAKSDCCGVQLSATHGKGWRIWQTMAVQTLHD